MVPTSPAILPISSTSSGTTRYCRPPVLMTANIVLFLRVRSRPRTGPGRLFVQSHGLISFPRARGEGLPAAQKQAARETPCAGWRLYSGPAKGVKATARQMPAKMPDLADFRPFWPARAAARWPDGRLFDEPTNIVIAPRAWKTGLDAIAGVIVGAVCASGRE